MPIDALSDDLTALLQMLKESDTLIKEPPASRAVDNHDGQRPNPLVERIAAAMLKRIRTG